MNSNIVSDRPALSSLLRIFLLIVILGWYVIGQGIGVAVAALFYDGDFIHDMQHVADHPALRNAMLLAQAVGATIGLIVIPIYYLKFTEHRSLKGFFKEENQWPLLVFLILLAVFGLGPAISPLTEWNATLQFPEWMSGFGNWVKETEAMAEAMIKTMTSNLSPLDFLFSVMVIGILPALGEELVFRGLIQTELIRATKNPHVAIWIASILFSAIHLQFMGFVPRLLMGAFLGYLYFWSGNLWISIIAHFFINTVQVIGLYFYQKGIITIDLESTDHAPWPWVAAGVALLLLSLLYLKNYFESHSNTSRNHA